MNGWKQVAVGSSRRSVRSAAAPALLLLLYKGGAGHGVRAESHSGGEEDEGELWEMRHLQQEKQSLPVSGNFNYGKMGSKEKPFGQIVFYSFFFMQNASPEVNFRWRKQMVILIMQRNIMMKYSSSGAPFHHSMYL